MEVQIVCWSKIRQLKNSEVEVIDWLSINKDANPMYYYLKYGDQDKQICNDVMYDEGKQ